MRQISDEEFERLTAGVPTAQQLEDAFAAELKRWRASAVPTWGENAARRFFFAGVEATRGASASTTAEAPGGPSPGPVR